MTVHSAEATLMLKLLLLMMMTMLLLYRIDARPFSRCCPADSHSVLPIHANSTAQQQQQRRRRHPLKAIDDAVTSQPTTVHQVTRSVPDNRD